MCKRRWLAAPAGSGKCHNRQQPDDKQQVNGSKPRAILVADDKVRKQVRVHDALPARKGILATPEKPPDHEYWKQSEEP